MPLIDLQGITLSYGLPPLFDDLSLTLDKGERACLVGRNGAGKSTLLGVIAGEIQPDSGVVRRLDGIRIAGLAQEVPAEAVGSVFDQVAGGLGDLADLVRRYHSLVQRIGSPGSPGRTGHRLHDRSVGAPQQSLDVRGDAGSLAPERRRAAGSDPPLLDELAEVQHRLEAGAGWEIEQRTGRILSRLRLDPDADFASLSGGLKRRVLLARALVQEPDLLLLDEPTNHLDIEAIEWLEAFLPEFPGALLFVTHDRVFQRRLATRILELDRGKLTDWPGDYANYLRRREERLHAEALANARFDRKLSEEEVWIRQGIKARRTRNEGRVRALEAMREDRRGRREQTGKARIRLTEAERSGALVVEAAGVTYSWGGEPVIRDLDALILRGDKVGIIGPNGVGKSTLLKLLLGELTPASGQIRLGTNLAVAYYDQMRESLAPEKSVQDNLAGGSDVVVVEGRSKHVLSYLKDFLFTAERARQPVKALSGGERNRLLLARLFAAPANLLVMDEPTNDLDAETLELLEDLLVGFGGTLLLVSHDRALLDAVVTNTLVFEGGGRVREYVGGYEDWLRQRPSPVKPAETSARRAPATPAPTAKAKETTNKPDGRASTRAVAKLSYKEQRELEALPAKIESLEAEQEALHARMADPAFYQQAGSAVAEARERLAAVDGELEQAYGRWEALEGRSEGRDE